MFKSLTKRLSTPLSSPALSPSNSTSSISSLNGEKPGFLSKPARASTPPPTQYPSPEIIQGWLLETEKGFDALFNDNFTLAEQIFLPKVHESPFHSIGYALLGYISAMLGLEEAKLAEAVRRLDSTEALTKKVAREVQKYARNFPSTVTKYPCTTVFEIIEADCIMMNATVQFLRESWMDYMKAAYKLRKAYKMFDMLYIRVKGVSSSVEATAMGGVYIAASEEDTVHDEELHEELHEEEAIDEDKDASGHPTPIDDELEESEKVEKLNVNVDELVEEEEEHIPETSDSNLTVDCVIEEGVEFGVGLFTLIFSMLPNKVNRIMNTLGFTSSRPFALKLLHSAYSANGLHSALSALVLLTYYTNIALFTNYLPASIRLEDAHAVLATMKLKFDRGRMFKLMEGKLMRMEGDLNGARQTLEDAAGWGSPEKAAELGEKFVQLEALIVYELGWCYILQQEDIIASSTFTTLTSMNSWSVIFYSYISASCLFAADAFDSAAEAFIRLPSLFRNRRFGGKMIPTEQYVARRLKGWTDKAKKFYPDLAIKLERGDLVEGFSWDGVKLEEIVVVNPLWELMYLWNGFSQIEEHILTKIVTGIEKKIEQYTITGDEEKKENSEQAHGTTIPSKKCTDPELACLYLLLGSALREQGHFTRAKLHFNTALSFESRLGEDRHVVPYTLYELAVLTMLEEEPKANTLAILGRAVEWNKGGLEYDFESRLYMKVSLLKEGLGDKGSLNVVRGRTFVKD